MDGPLRVRLLALRHGTVLLPRQARCPAGPTGPPAVPRLGSDRNPLSLARVRRLFDFAKSHRSAHGHEMRRLMAEQGIESREVFACAAVDHGILVPHPTTGTFLWSYHVTSTVAVQTEQGVVRMVIAPSLFDGPVTIDRWRAAMSCDRAVLQEDLEDDGDIERTA